MAKWVVTIGREFGSLGRPIAARVAELLEVAYYDRDIVEEIAQRMDLPVRVISDEEERVENQFGILGKCLYPLGSGGSTLKQKIFSVQECVLNDFADKGNCILVGRCADYVMRHRENLMRIYIYAPLDKRVQNAMKLMNVSQDDARRVCLEVDRARSKYHRRYAGYDVMDPDHFDLMLNSDACGVEGTAQMLAEIIRLRFKDCE